MRIDVLSKEYPPEVYGGAGVHVAELVRALRVQPDVDARVRCFGAPALGARHDGVRRAGVARRGQRCHPHAGRRPRDGRRLRRGRPRPLAHLVRQHGRPPRRADARHPPRRQRPLPRADAAVEGRAARRRLRPVELGGAHGVRGRRRHRRGQRRDARRRAAQLSVGRPRAGARRAQRHRHHRVGARAQPRPRPRARRRPRPAERDLRRPDHPPEGPAALPACRRRAAARGPARAVRRRARHPRDRGRGARARRGPGRDALRASCGSPRCCPAPTSSRC